MPSPAAERLREIQTFPQLVKYLRDELDWPIRQDSFEDLVFDFTPDELGIDPENAVKIQEIQQLRPLSSNQPWGIFFVKFAPKRLPVVAMRRMLNGLVIKKRATAKDADRTRWRANDLLFLSSYGESHNRAISLAHFCEPEAGGHNDLPTLKVLGWDGDDTSLKLEHVAQTLKEKLVWPQDERDLEAWRRWRGAFRLRPREAITQSKDLSIRLAELAKAIRARIVAALVIETSKGPLTRLMKAFQEALVHDLTPDGFADMYAQTIAYGLLSARIADPLKKTADDFTAHMRTNPFLRELMETFLKVGGRHGKAGGPGIDFDELGVSEVVELLDEADMEAVVRDFGDRKRQEDPVIHFYELFLSAYNKKLKIQRGVFYTPQPVVSYIVRSVHELLQTEFGLADGLADTTTWGEMLIKHPGLKLPPLTDEPGEKRTISPDEPFVQILDPATGTATFLVEVIDVIHLTLTAKWKQQRLTDTQQRAEWNDYVPKHLLPRLHAYELMMAPYAIAHMKIGLKLAETGYRFGTEERARIYLTNALEPWVKQLPLIGFDALAHEAEAVNEIKRHKRFTIVIGNPPYSNFGMLNKNPFILGLLEDYKRGLDEKKINLDDDFIKFIRFAHALVEITSAGAVGMITNNVFIDGITHRRMRESLCETFRRIRVLDLHGNTSAKEVTDDGSKDENVFDITQGVAISLFSRGPGYGGMEPAVSFSDLRGLRTAKYKRLLANGVNYTALESVAPHFFFVPKDFGHATEFEAYVPLSEMFRTPSYGIQTKRDALTIGFDREEVLERALYLIQHNDEAVRAQFDLAADGRDWSIKWARTDLKRLGDLRPHLRRVLYRPFDFRWTIYTDKSKGFVAYPRWETMRCMLDDNLALIGMRQVFQDFDMYSHVGVTNLLIDERTFYSNRGGTYLFPLYEASDKAHGLFMQGERPHNLATAFLKRLVGVSPSPEDTFRYAFSTLSSRTYRTRYAGVLKIGYPRVPLPGSANLFRELARLGGELTALHLLESPRLDQPITEFIGSRNPEVEKVSWSRDTVWVDKAQTTGFKGVPEEVWNFHIGGYQVCEKWLKDRKGRTLSKDDIAHYQKVVVALKETIRLMKEIDEAIEEHGGWPGAFASHASKTVPYEAALAQVPAAAEPKAQPGSKEK